MAALSYSTASNSHYTPKYVSIGSGFVLNCSAKRSYNLSHPLLRGASLLLGHSCGPLLGSIGRGRVGVPSKLDAPADDGIALQYPRSASVATLKEICSYK